MLTGRTSPKSSSGRTPESSRFADLQRDGNAVAEGDDRSEHSRVFGQPFVVGANGPCLGRSGLPVDVSTPQDVVRHEEATDPQALDDRVEHRGISGLVDVVEYVVEGTFDVVQNRLRVADENLDLRRHAGLLHILPRNRRGVGIVLDRDKLAIVGQRASEPCPRVANRGAELEDSPRANRAREDMEETPLSGSDDWPLLSIALLFTHPPNRIPFVCLTV